MARLFLKLCIACVLAITWVSTSLATEYKVVLLGGQSNMNGKGRTKELPAELQKPQADIAFAAGYYHEDRRKVAWTTLRPETSHGEMFGPEITFGRAMADRHPNEKYALIKYAVGGTNLYAHWKASTSQSPVAGPVYRAFLATVDENLKVLKDRGDTYTIVGMLWLQGESDVDAKAAGEYEQNLIDLIADIRSRYGRDLPFIMGGIANAGPRSGEISKIHAKVAASVPNVRYFNNDDLWSKSGDVLHFTAAAQQVIGRRFADALEPLLVRSTVK